MTIPINLACRKCAEWKRTDSELADARMMVDAETEAVSIIATCPGCGTREARFLAASIAAQLVRALKADKRVIVLPDRQRPKEPGELSIDMAIDMHFDFDKEYEELCRSSLSEVATASLTSTASSSKTN